MAAGASMREDPRLRSDDPYDVAVIGAGVVGAAIARELARLRLRTILVEASSDVGAGTSKANTAILHTGFDAKPGTLESRLVRRGHALARRVRGRGRHPARAPRRAAGGVGRGAARGPAGDRGNRRAERLHRGRGGRRRRALSPRAAPRARGARRARDPGRGHRLPVHDAARVRDRGRRERRRPAARRAGHGRRRAADDLHALATPRGRVSHASSSTPPVSMPTGSIVSSDTTAFTVTPRRGELIVFDKLARPLVRHVILPVPTKAGKGVLVSPTVFGNVVLGPTAEDVPDKSAADSTAAGLASLLAKGRRIVPALVDEEVTAVYVGLRAATEHADYQIAFHGDARYVCVGGIRSTGLTAAMAIAERVVEGLRDMGLAAEQRAGYRRSACRTSAKPRRAAVSVGSDDRGESRLRPDRLPLRARDAWRDRRRDRRGDPGAHDRRPPPAHARAARPLPGLLLRRRGPPPARRRQRALVRRPARRSTVRGRERRGPRSSSAAAPPVSRRRSSSARRGVGPVVVLEREREAGGVPRHTDHTGFGLRDLHRMLSGPRYAARYRRLAARAGVDVRTETTVDAACVGSRDRARSRLGRAATARPHAARRRPRDGLPRTSARRAARRRRAAARRASRRDASAAVALEHARSVAARVVVGAEHVSFSRVSPSRTAAPHGRDGDRPARATRATPRSRGSPPAGGAFRSSPHGGDAHPRTAPRRGRRGDRLATGADAADRLRHRRLHRRLDPRPRAGAARRASRSTPATRAPRVDGALRTLGARRVRRRQSRPRRRDAPTSRRSPAVTSRPASGRISPPAHGPRARRCRSSASRRSAGSRRARSTPRAPRSRTDASCCASMRSVRAPCSRRARTRACSGAAATGSSSRRGRSTPTRRGCGRSTPTAER